LKFDKTSLSTGRFLKTRKKGGEKYGTHYIAEAACRGIVTYIIIYIYIYIYNKSLSLSLSLSLYFSSLACVLMKSKNAAISGFYDILSARVFLRLVATLTYTYTYTYAYAYTCKSLPPASCQHRVRKACHRAALWTPPSWTLFPNKVSLSLSLSRS